MVELSPYYDGLDLDRELAFRSEVTKKKQKKKAEKKKKKKKRRKQTDKQTNRVLFPTSQNHMQIQASSTHWEITYS